ncbi:XTP/dITP diphosphatase [Ammoniphilus sp. CFH 90114]|uniref:XTP/dITP diphosphatase n=1 Tax=Ammoniphilus sp. CFH 90114 TaxID=2493665 RepID=UPI00100E1A0A|nr:XTP/dITP diphosphatase [Ammoniphilus sp. CFH 90114]RXT14671.1 XTP/dITP diphosphatase [Ammoniphilus sp. CFH 90114]
MQKQLVLATRNKGKVQELKAMLAGYDIEVMGLDQFLNCPEVEEDQDTFEGNAIKKAQTIAEFLQVPALADDSGLEVDALQGRPGVYSARFAGVDATDEDNNRKLLELMQGVPTGERSGRFRCVLALAVPGQATATWHGTCEGKIGITPRGTGGFGYDPLFFLPIEGKTMAEFTKEEKSKISHRGMAMRKMMVEIAGLM